MNDSFLWIIKISACFGINRRLIFLLSEQVSDNKVTQSKEPKFNFSVQQSIIKSFGLSDKSLTIQTIHLVLRQLILTQLLSFYNKVSSLVLPYQSSYEQ